MDNNSKIIWNYFKSKGLNEYAIAGLMGNLYAESGLKPNNLQNTVEKRLNLSDDEYVISVDNGTYKNFITDKGGFGLAQWTSSSRKKEMYEFHQKAGKSIGDLNTQLDFLYYELSEKYKTKIWNVLINSKSILEASNLILMKFERPADQSERVQNKRLSYGKEFYNYYKSEDKEENTNMAVKIGHAVGDERGSGRGGAAGDQNGKEVLFATWYKKDWDFIIRAKDPKVAEIMAITCEQGVENPYIGYDKGQRNTILTEARKVNFNLSAIKTPCECDCSSFMCICAIAAGVPENKLYISGNLRATTTMKSAFNKLKDMFDIYTDTKYRTTDEYLKRGDIVVNVGSHTFMVLSNGAKAGESEKIEVEIPKAPEISTNSGVLGIAVALGSVNVRKGPSTAYAKVGIVRKGQKVEVVEITSNNWYKIIWNNDYAYVSNRTGSYFNFNQNSDLKGNKVKITGNSLYVRSGPSTAYKAVTTVHKGEIYELEEEKNNWGKLSNGLGWISLKYAQKV